MNKKLLRLIVAACIIIAGVVNVSAQVKGKTNGGSKSAATSTPDGQAIENVVREYLLKNPEVVRDALQALQAKEETERRDAAAANMKRLAPEIYTDVDSPVLGNAKGDVSIVVFFDYFCGYCKKTLPALQALVAADSSVRVVYKEFPIMGPHSDRAARAALAADRQGKYAEFHRAMIIADGTGDEMLKSVSQSLGIDHAKLQTDMNDPKISAAIDRNTRLAAALNVEGTPAYLIGGRVIPGGVDLGFLTSAVKEERAKLARLNTQSAGLKE